VQHSFACPNRESGTGVSATRIPEHNGRKLLSTPLLESGPHQVLLKDPGHPWQDKRSITTAALSYDIPPSMKCLATGHRLPGDLTKSIHCAKKSKSPAEAPSTILIHSPNRYIGEYSTLPGDYSPPGPPLDAQATGFRQGAEMPIKGTHHPAMDNHLLIPNAVPPFPVLLRRIIFRARKFIFLRNPITPS